MGTDRGAATAVGIYGALAGVVAAQFAGQENLDRLAEPFLAPVAEQTFDLAIDRRDGAAAIDGNRAVETNLDREPIDF